MHTLRSMVADVADETFGTGMPGREAVWCMIVCSERRVSMYHLKTTLYNATQLQCNQVSVSKARRGVFNATSVVYFARCATTDIA